MIKGTRDRRGFRAVGILLAVFAASAAGGFGPGGRAVTLVAAPHTTLPLRGRPIEAALRQPLRFDALDSQDFGRGGFVSRGNGYAVLLEQGGAVVSMSGRPKSSSSPKTPDAAAVVRMTWPGANRRVRPAGLDAATGVSNYLIGNDPARWRLGVASFGRVEYRELYPGIDLAFYGNQERLEYDFVVAAGGDPRAIRLRFSGEDTIHIDANGDLVVRAGAAEIIQQAPVVYQDHEGTKQRVAGRYVKTNRHEVGFVVAPYDRTRTLYIDPVLVFSTFLGGSGSDSATAVAVDSAGYAYVTGTSRSFNLTSEDVFVAKISPAGALVYATYVGDDNTNDRGRGIAVDSAGNAYVTGDTSYPGSGTSFPIVNGFVPTTSPTVSGGAILFKLNPAGDSLLYSTVLRSGSTSVGYGVALEGANAYVVGQTIAGQGFPIWPDSGPYSGFIGGLSGQYYSFIVKINTSNTGLASLAYATRFGGSDSNYAAAVAANTAGEAYVTGYTTAADFPVVGGAAQPVCGTGSNCNNRVQDAFVSKFNAAGTALLYSTYAGGSGADVGNAIAIDGSGSAYVSGSTFSLDFPVTPGTLDNACSTVPGCSFSDGFVFKLSPTGSSFVYSTYLGGQSEDAANAIAVDSAGNAHVAGYSGSPDFPVTGDAFQPARAGTNTDAFVSVLNTTGTALVYSSYLGGTGNISGGDKAFGIALDSAGSAWIVGQTDSLDFPVTPGTVQPAHGGGQFDGFVVKVGSRHAVTPFDADGDGKSELFVFRPSNGTWYTRYSAQGYSTAAAGAFQWGLPGDIPISGDFDGDGKMELTVFRPSNGTWYIRYSTLGYSLASAGVFQWGLPGDVPIAADFDGDGKTEITVWRPSSGTWYIRYSSFGFNIGNAGVFQWGLPGDVPLTGDFDGDGKTELTVFRPANGTWYIRYSAVGYGGSFDAFQWGLPGDLPISADFDGDGKLELTVFRPSNGTWYIRYSTLGYSLASAGAFQWGLPGDVPIAADFDGDGKTEITVWRPTNGTWYVRYSSFGFNSSNAGVFQWGLPGDAMVK